MSQIASLNSNQSLFATNSLSKFSLESDKELPKWLLEFDSYTREEDSKQDYQQARPLTESQLRNRPKWFEELTQRRRLSDIYAMEIGDASATLSKASLFGDGHNHMTADRIRSSISELDELEQENNPKLRSERKFSKESVFVVPQNDLLDEKQPPNGSAGGNLQPLLSEANSLEDAILTFSTSKSIEKLKINEMTVELEECIIPEMPRGSELTLQLLANWGDEQFIGLNGIEILDQWGQRPVVKNILLQDQSNNGQASTELSKLVDNVNRTHDDCHIWQCNTRTKQLPLQIVLQLQQPVTIALIRIWNYNKSRIHSYRGVKLLQIKLNEQLIFSGEIAKATGDLTGSVQNFGDTILFTTNETVLEYISKYDTAFQELLMDQTMQQVSFKM